MQNPDLRARSRTPPPERDIDLHLPFGLIFGGAIFGDRDLDARIETKFRLYSVRYRRCSHETDESRQIDQQTQGASC
jgi:hypothetical protein